MSPRLGVSDDESVPGSTSNMGDGLLQCLQALHAEGFVEREIGLVGAGDSGRRVNNRPVELKNAGYGHQRRVRVQPHTYQAAGAPAGPLDSFHKGAH